MTAALAPADAPPADETELSSRARALSGRTVGELGAALGVDVPADQRRAKGLVGTLVERMLGADAGTRAGPDFEALGVELKTLPVDASGRPRESTYVCSIPLGEVSELEWDGSPVRRKLARVLWVPVEADPGRPLAERRLGAPWLWSPRAEQEAALRADWDELAGLIGAGYVEAVTGHLGRVMQVRPKAADSHARRRAPEAGGAWVLTVPRGFYLRAGFTTTILRAALDPGAIRAPAAASRSGG